MRKFFPLSKKVEDYIMGHKIAQYMNEYEESVEPKCLNGTITPFPEYTGLGAEWYRNFVGASHQISHLGLIKLMLSSIRASTVMAGSINNLIGLSAAVDNLRRQTQQSLLGSVRSYGLLGTFREDFKSLEHVEPQSRSLVDLTRYGVAPQLNNLTKVDRDTITVTATNELISVSTLKLERDEDQNKLIALIVRAETSEPVSVRADIPCPISGAKYFEVNLPVLNGMEFLQIFGVTTKGDVVELISEHKPDQTSYSGVLEVSLLKLIVTMVSDTTDGSDNNGRYHVLGIDSVWFGQSPVSVSQWDFYSTPIQFAGTDNFRKVRFESVMGGPEGTRPEFWICALDKSGHWTDWKSVKSDEIVDFSQTEILHNSSEASRLIVSMQDNQLAKLDYSISATYLSGAMKTLDTDQYTGYVEPEGLICLRDVGKKNMTSLDDNLLGWRFIDGAWTTFLYVSDDTSIDLGTTKIRIDGMVRTGEVLIKPGLHRADVPAEFFSTIPSGLNQNNIKEHDALFPYNGRYLIQGYPGILQYNGVDVFGAYSCEYVDSDYMQNLEKPDYSVFSFLMQDYNLVPVFMIEDNYKRYKSERVFIWAKRVSLDATYTQVKLRIHFPPTNTVGAYVKSYTLMAG